MTRCCRSNTRDRHECSQFWESRELRGSVLVTPRADVPVRPAGRAAAEADVPAPASSARADDLRLATVSRDHVRRTLDRAGGNKKHAAEMLGVSRRAFYRLLGRLNLEGNIRKRT